MKKKKKKKKKKMLNRIRDYTPSFLFTAVSSFERIWFVRIRNPFEFAGNAKMDSIENKNEGRG